MTAREARADYVMLTDLETHERPDMWVYSREVRRALDEIDALRDRAERGEADARFWRQVSYGRLPDEQAAT